MDLTNKKMNKYHAVLIDSDIESRREKTRNILKI
jgi:hypothetical protein